jgi:ABC-type uncharacterized transport system ATPase subunit
MAHTPDSDSAAIRQIIRALRNAGWQLHCVHDGEGSTPVSTETEALDAITAVDAATLVVLSGVNATDHGHVLFVLGNEPFEVAADYTTNLSAVIEPLTNSWW